MIHCKLVSTMQLRFFVPACLINNHWENIRILWIPVYKRLAGKEGVKRFDSRFRSKFLFYTNIIIIVWKLTQSDIAEIGRIRKKMDLIKHFIPSLLLFFLHFYIFNEDFFNPPWELKSSWHRSDCRVRRKTEKVVKSNCGAKRGSYVRKHLLILVKIH